MKREIKFRGKRTDNGEWVFGFYWETDIATYITCEAETKHQDKPVIPESVGQLTGLKDKNGKEIYEGDIVNSHDEILTVIFNTAMGSWDLMFQGGNSEALVLEHGWENSRIEVVGNLQDTPELVK